MEEIDDCGIGESGGWVGGSGGAAEAEKALSVRGGLCTVGLTGVAPALASGAQLESESVSSCTRCSGSSGSGEVSWACALRAGQRSAGVPPGWGQRWLSAPPSWVGFRFLSSRKPSCFPEIPIRMGLVVQTSLSRVAWAVDSSATQRGKGAELCLSGCHHAGRQRTPVPAVVLTSRPGSQGVRGPGCLSGATFKSLQPLSFLLSPSLK